MVEEGVLSSVKKIVDVYVADNGVRYFRISWKDTWEPELHLISCEELLEKFWKEKENCNKVIHKDEDKTHVKVEDTCDESSATISFCKCRKPPNTKSNRKPYNNKSTQHSVKTSETGIQVNTYQRKHRDILIQVGSGIVNRYDLGIQVGSGIVTRSDLGVQVNTYHKGRRSVLVQAGTGVVGKSESGIEVNGSRKKHRKVQVGTGIVIKSDVGIQVNTYRHRNRSVSVQCTPKTVERGTQDKITYKNQCSQFEELFRKEISTQFTPLVEDHHKSIHLDECSQYEDSFLNDSNDGITQREVSTQFHPRVIHCGIQAIVYSHDQFTQCNENIFQKEVGCQYNPKTISCGVQKDTLLLNKYSQYELPFVETVKHIPSTAVKYIPSTEPKQIPSTAAKHIPSTNVNIPSSNVNIPSTNVNIPSTNVNIPSSILKVCYDNSTQANNTRPYQENILQRHHTDVKNTQHSNKHPNEKFDCNLVSQLCTELYSSNNTGGIQLPCETQKTVVGHQVLDFNTTVDHTDKMDKMKEMIFVTDVPLSMQKNVAEGSHKSVNIADASTSVLPDKNTVQNPSLCVLLSNGEDAILPSRDVPVDTLSEDVMFQSSHGCVQDVSSTQISANISLPQDIILQPNTLVEGQTILDLEKPALTQPVIVPSQNEYPSGEVTIINSPHLIKHTLSDDLITNDAVPVVTIVDDCPSPLICHDNSSDSVKQKRKRRSERNGDITNSNDKKPKTKKKKNVIFVDQTNSDMGCLPVYDISPTVKDELNVSAIMENSDANDGFDTDVIKLGNSSSSDANGINDDFISRYWK